MQYAEDADLDDRGEFRAGKLSPGRYALAADPARHGLRLPLTYQGTFYPASLEPSSAARIDLHAGQDVTGIEIKLQTAATYSIRGRVSGANPMASTEPSRQPYLSVERVSGTLEAFPSGAVAKTNRDGTFEVTGVISGTYRLAAGTFFREGFFSTGSARAGEAIVQVEGHDVDGVQIEAVAPIRVAGSIRLEGATQPEWKHCSIGLRGGNGYQYTQIAEDGSFTYQNIARNVYRAYLYMPEEARYYVKAVHIGSVESPGRVVDLRTAGNEQLTIVLSDKPARIQGTVQADPKPDTAHLTVVLIPETDDSEKRSNEAVQGTFDQNGTFSLTGIPPGNYRLFAWLDLPEDAWMDDEFWNAMKDKGTSVKLEEGDRKSLQLPMISPAETGAWLTRLDLQ
jgi:hypothetical protein